MSSPSLKKTDPSDSLPPEPERPSIPRLGGYVPPVPRHRSAFVPAVIVAALFLLVAVGIIVFVRNWSGQITAPRIDEPDRTEELLAWVPADSEIVVHINIRDLSENPDMRSVIDSRGTLMDGSALTANMLDHLCFAGKVRPDNVREAVAVFRFRNDYDPNTLFTEAAAQTKRRNGKVYYKLAENKWIHCPTSRRLVMCQQEQTLTRLLGVSEEAPRGDLKTAFAGADGPIRAAAVGPSAQPDIRFDFSPWVRVPSRDRPHPLVLSAIGSSKLRRDALELQTTRTYSSSDKAKQAAAQMREVLDAVYATVDRLAKPSDPNAYLLKVIYDSWSIEAHGARTEEVCRIPIRSLPTLLNLLTHDR
jgi:hypothetical protein